MHDGFNACSVRSFACDSVSDDLSTPDPVRALYNGDVASSILQKFASWYQDNYNFDLDHINDSYYCVRLSNGDYRFYVGQISESGVITDADVVEYSAVSSGGYSTAWTWTVSHVQSGRVDLDGYSGYIYSSYSSYPSNPYMTEVRTNQTLCLSVLACLCVLVGYSLYRIVRGWFHAGENSN